MARYANDLPTDRPWEETWRIVAAYLTSEGFSCTTRKGEQIWQKGLGLMLGPQFVKVEPRPGAVHVEAWIKWAILPGVYAGELDTSGALGAIPKKKLRERIAQIEAVIIGPPTAYPPAQAPPGTTG